MSCFEACIEPHTYVVFELVCTKKDKRLTDILVFPIYSPHAWAHNGVGSVMADVYSSASDPTFFMHHLFIDNQYASWQEAGGADGTRKTQVDGACSDGNNPCTALTPQTVLEMNGLAENKLVGDVLDTHSETLCYRYDYLV